MCMLLGVVTHSAWGRIFKISPLKICAKKFCTILLEKKANLPVGPEIAWYQLIIIFLPCEDRKFK